jgi:hypothetical protein
MLASVSGESAGLELGAARLTAVKARRSPKPIRGVVLARGVTLRIVARNRTGRPHQG